MDRKRTRWGLYIVETNTPTNIYRQYGTKPHYTLQHYTNNTHILVTTLTPIAPLRRPSPMYLLRRPVFWLLLLVQALLLLHSGLLLPLLRLLLLHAPQLLLSLLDLFHGPRRTSPVTTATYWAISSVIALRSSVNFLVSSLPMPPSHFFFRRRLSMLPLRPSLSSLFPLPPRLHYN